MGLKTTVSLLLLPLLGLCTAHHGDEHGADNEIPMENPDTEDITTTILRMNNGSSDFLLEGDVMIPKTRNAMKCFSKAYSCLWPKSANGMVEIPFVISEKYVEVERKEIISAIRGLEASTCIRFLPRATERAYIIFEPRSGCSSLVGYSGGRQTVSLQKYGCVQKGIIQHELLHALGFYHEHTRSDRDQYVKIVWENIFKFAVYNFRLMDSNNLNTPYDYTSIMQYGRTAFGVNGRDTIVPIPDSTVPIGQRKGVSNVDIFRINKLYKCWNYL